jgi:hypothetical protein
MTTINSLHNVNNNDNKNIEIGSIYKDNDYSNDDLRITESSNSMLLHVSDLEEPFSKGNLLYNLKEYDNIKLFINISAILSIKSKLIPINEFKFLSTKDKIIKILDISYSILAWITVIFGAILIIFIAMSDLRDSDLITYDTRSFVLKIIYYASLLFQNILVIISRIYIDKRFHLEVKTYEIPFYNQIVHIGQIYIGIGMCLAIPFIFQNIYEQQFNFIIIKLCSSYFTILTQSVIIIFVVVDN